MSGEFQACDKHAHVFVRERFSCPACDAEKLASDHDALLQQRDELAEALRRALNFKSGDYQNGQGWEQMARAALARIDTQVKP